MNKIGCKGLFSITNIVSYEGLETRMKVTMTKINVRNEIAIFRVLRIKVLCYKFNIYIPIINFIICYIRDIDTFFK